MSRMFYLTSLSLLLFSGCMVGEKGSGIAVTEERQIDEFDSISASGSANVRITIGPERSVKVTFDDNLISKCKTEVENGELKVYTTGSWNSKIGLNVEVTTPTLNSIEASGASDVVVDDYSGSELEVSVSGAAEADVNGLVGKLTLGVSGSGDAKMKELICKSADVSVSGAGDVTITATESVTARATGSGDIEIHGNPAQIAQSTTGAGDVTIKK